MHRKAQGAGRRQPQSGFLHSHKLWGAALTVLGLVALGLTACGGGPIRLTIDSAMTGTLYPGQHVEIEVSVQDSSSQALASGGVLRAWLGPTGSRPSKDVPASSATRLPLVAAASSAHISLAVILNSNAGGAGRHGLWVCATGISKQEVCSASKTLTIAQPAPYVVQSGQRSTAQLVEADMNAGRLTQDQALQIDAYALTGDPRLPLQYQSDVGVDPSDFRAAITAAPSVTQASLAPYLQPPFLSSSWWALRNDPTHATASSAASPGCGVGSGPLLGDWSYEPQDGGGYVKVWYLTQNPQEKAVAAALVQEANTELWPLDFRLLGRYPPQDGGGACRGGDNRLDISLVSNLPPQVFGETWVYLPETATACNGPSYVLMSDAFAKFGQLGWAPSVLAHEVFHAFQNAFAMPVQSCTPYNWFLEGSAAWGEYEWEVQTHAQLTTDLSNPVCTWVTNLAAGHSLGYTDKQFEYASWIADDYATYGSGGRNPVFVEAVMSGLSHADALSSFAASLDAASLADWWSSFTANLWNIAPFNTFHDWYGSTCSTQSINVPQQLPLDRVLPLPMNIPHLSATTYQVLVGPSITGFRIHQNSGTPLDFLKVYMLGNGTWVRTLGIDTMCLGPASTSRVVDLLISNGQIATDSTGTLELEPTTVECRGWIGSVDGTADYRGYDGRTNHRSWHADVAYAYNEQGPPEKFGYGTPLGSFATITWSLSAYAPAPYPFYCPNTETAGPWSFTAGPSDGIDMGVFPLDPPPLGLRLYTGLGTTDSPQVSLPNAECWEGTNVTSLQVPWLVTGGPSGQHLVAADGRSFSGNYSTGGVVPSGSGTWSASWSWSFKSPPIPGTTPQSPQQIGLQAPATSSTAHCSVPLTCGPIGLPSTSKP